MLIGKWKENERQVNENEWKMERNGNKKTSLWERGNLEEMDDVTRMYLNIIVMFNVECLMFKGL